MTDPEPDIEEPDGVVGAEGTYKANGETWRLQIEDPHGHNPTRGYADPETIEEGPGLLVQRAACLCVLRHERIA